MPRHEIDLATPRASPRTDREPRCRFPNAGRAPLSLTFWHQCRVAGIRLELAPRQTVRVSFTARKNSSEQTLLLWQDDVKLDWRVELNGRRLGSLFLMESPLVFALPVPAGALRDGSNSLSIVPPRENDDIRVGELKLSAHPFEALAECAAEIRVTDGVSGQPLPAASR